MASAYVKSLEEPALIDEKSQRLAMSEYHNAATSRRVNESVQDEGKTVIMKGRGDE